MPGLVCNLQPEYGCYQARSQGRQRGKCPPTFQSFQVNIFFEVWAKKYFSATQQNCSNKPILLQILVEYELVYDLL